MTLQNDAIYIPDEILTCTFLSWREKYAYAYILQYSINKSKPFLDPRILAYKMQIDVPNALLLMGNLKEHNMI